MGLTLEGLEIPRDGDEAVGVQSLVGEAGLVAPLIVEEAIVLGDVTVPSTPNLFD